MLNLLYFGVNNNSHDKRFIETLKKLGEVETYFQAEDLIVTFEATKYHAIIVGPLTLPMDFLPPNPKIPIIGISHAFDINETGRDSQDYKTLLKNFEMFDRVICDNSHIKETIEREFKPKFNIDLVPYGCDLGELIELKPHLGGKLRLLSMRNWTRIHSNHKIIESLSILKNQNIVERVIFIGDGPELQEGIMSFKNSKARMQAEFRGFVNMESIKSAFSDCNVYVSSSRSDGSSVSLMEAMAAGLIPCVTDHASNLRIITDGINGFTYRNQDPDSLAESLIKISNLSEETRYEISRNARDYAKLHFDWESNQELLQKSVMEALHAK